MAKKQKKKKNSDCVNIDQMKCVTYTSLDSSQHALQTNGELFTKFVIIFRIYYIF